MYVWKNDKLRIARQNEAAIILGITRQWLSAICTGKVQIRKLMAYCITKYINPEAEILDYFEYIEKGE